MATTTGPTTHEATSAGRPKLVFARIARVLVYFVYGFAMVAVVILTIAFFLKLFAANPEAPFSEWIYRATRRIMQPFRGLFPPVEGEQGSVLDLSLLFAMLMYGLLAVAVHALVVWLNRKVASMSGAPTGQQMYASPGAAQPGTPPPTGSAGPPGQGSYPT